MLKQMDSNLTQEIISIVDFLLSRPIAFNPALKCLDIGIGSAVFLSQCIYMSSSDMAKTNHGWWTLSQTKITELTALSEKEQRTARTQLKAQDFFFEKKKGSPPKIWFYLDKQKLYLKLYDIIQGKTKSKNKIAKIHADTLKNKYENQQFVLKGTINSEPKMMGKNWKGKNQLLPTGTIHNSNKDLEEDRDQDRSHFRKSHILKLFQQAGFSEHYIAKNKIQEVINTLASNEIDLEDVAHAIDKAIAVQGVGSFRWEYIQTILANDLRAKQKSQSQVKGDDKAVAAVSHCETEYKTDLSGNPSLLEGYEENEND